MSNPENLKYNKSHEWVKLDGDIATIGITDFAQHELTDIVYVELPPLDKELTAGNDFGVVESVKTASDLYSPISGKVIEVNSQLDSKPDLVNTDPFGAGWMIKLKISNKDELNKLLSAKEYTELTKS